MYRPPIAPHSLLLSLLSYNIVKFPPCDFPRELAQHRWNTISVSQYIRGGIPTINGRWGWSSGFAPFLFLFLLFSKSVFYGERSM